MEEIKIRDAQGITTDSLETLEVAEIMRDKFTECFEKDQGID